MNERGFVVGRKWNCCLLVVGVGVGVGGEVTTFGGEEKLQRHRQRPLVSTSTVGWSE